MKMYIKFAGRIGWETYASEGLKELGHSAKAFGPGMVELHDGLTLGQMVRIEETLYRLGIELAGSRKQALVERMKHLIANLVLGDLPVMNYSDCISGGLAHNYGYLSSLFSVSEGITVQQFIISQRIERATELMESGGLSLTQIADRLNYSSVAHLSNQFKKVKGRSPTCYLRECRH